MSFYISFNIHQNKYFLSNSTTIQTLFYHFCYFSLPLFYKHFAITVIDV